MGQSPQSQHSLIGRSVSVLVWRGPMTAHGVSAPNIDFDSTLVATSTDCAAALLSDDRFEAVTVQPKDRLDLYGDVINR